MYSIIIFLSPKGTIRFDICLDLLQFTISAICELKQLNPM